jgi:hypothetical protein
MASVPPDYLDFGGPARYATWGDRWRAFQKWRTARAAHKALARDLASFQTPAEVHELNAILARYDDEEVAEIRRIIDHCHSH